MWFPTALVSGSLFGISDIIVRHVLKNDINYIWLLIMVGLFYGLFSILFTAGYLVYRKSKGLALNIPSISKDIISKTKLPFKNILMFSAVIAAIYFPADALFNLSMSKTTNAGYSTAALLVSSVLLVYFFSVYMFKENRNPIAFLGVLLIITGAALIKIFGD